MLFQRLNGCCVSAELRLTNAACNAFCRESCSSGQRHNQLFISGGGQFLWDFIWWRHRAYSTVVHLFRKRSHIKFSSQHFWKWELFSFNQWSTEVWWCSGQLLDWISLPNCSSLLNSGVWWSLLLDVHCLWRHIMTSNSRLQTNVLVKFMDKTRMLFYMRTPYSLLYNVSLLWT